MRQLGLISVFLVASLSNLALADDSAKEDSAIIEPITFAEFTVMQRTLFDKADANFDGRLTNSEIQALKTELDKPKHKKSFYALDTNNNGYVTLSEMEDKHEEFTAERVKRALASKERLLQRYDLDENGAISSRELDSYFEKLAEKQKSDTKHRAKKDFEMKDEDKDGYVSLDEYLSSKKPDAVLRFVRSSVEGLSLRRDKNSDQIVTRTENEAFIDDIFAALDKNGDKRLSGVEQGNKAYASSKRLEQKHVYVKATE